VTHKIAVDADSILYRSCYRHKHMVENDDSKMDRFLEYAYFEFCGEISKIKQAIFNGPETYSYGDDVKAVICLSPKHTFRHDIFPDYKANRKTTPVPGISRLKQMVRDRLAGMVYYKDNVEADDLVIYLAKELNYRVAAIDKDVLNACPTESYNYSKFEWNMPKTEAQIEKWYLMQALMGDKDDNIPGAKGIGSVGAFNIVHGVDPKQKNVKLTWEQTNYRPTFEDIVPHFPSEAEARISMMLVRMDQFNGKEIIPWVPHTKI